MRITAHCTDATNQAIEIETGGGSHTIRYPSPDGPYMEGLTIRPHVTDEALLAVILDRCQEPYILKALADLHGEMESRAGAWSEELARAEAEKAQAEAAEAARVQAEDEAKKAADEKAQAEAAEAARVQAEADEAARQEAFDAAVDAAVQRALASRG